MSNRLELWEDGEMRGHCWELSFGNVIGANQFDNDSVSSVRVPANYKATVF